MPHSFSASPRACKTRSALHLGWILGILLLTSCSSSKEEAAAAVGDGSDLPRLYWKVELVAVNVFNPEGLDDLHFTRLFDDGRIVATQLSPSGEKVVVRSAETGVWKDVQIPAGQEGSYLTWYEDDKNLGGYYYNSPSHGYAMVDGVLHTFLGPPGYVRGRLPDSSLMIDFSAGGYRYFQKWTFGATLQDELDAHLYFYQDPSKERIFAKLAQDGTFLLLAPGTGDSPQAVIRDGKSEPIGPLQFHLTDPLDMDREMIIPCCRILTIDRLHGGILGIKGGKPVIKNGDTYDKVADEHGEPVAVNGRGDVIYTSTDSKPFHAPRMRFKGKLYQFSFLDWARVAKIPSNIYGTGLPTVADMNEKGQVLFAVTPVGQGGSSANLYLATPSLETVAPTAVANLTFTVKSGPGKNLAPIHLLEPTLVTGSFSESNLTLSIAVPTTVGGPTRSLFVSVTGSGQSPFNIDSPLPAKTTVVGTALVTASTSYADPARALTLVASAGAFRVKSQTPVGGFTVAFEYIEFTAKDGTVYQLNGEATVL